MSNPETKAQYEGAILNQLVKNAEKLSVIEFKFSQIEPKIDNLDHRLSEIEPKIDNLDHRLSEIEKLLGWLKIIGGGVLRDRTIFNCQFHLLLSDLAVEILNLEILSNSRVWLVC